MPPVPPWVSSRRVSSERTTRRGRDRRSCTGRPTSSDSSMVSSMRARRLQRLRQLVVRGRPRWSRRSAPRRRCTSNSSTCLPSTACGSRGPRRISRSGPATAVITWLAVHVLAAHPGPDLAVAEPDHPLVPDRHGALDADRPAARCRPGRRRSASGRGSVTHARVRWSRWSPAPRCCRRTGGVHGAALVRRAEQPAAVLGGAEQRGEAGGGVEARQARASRPSRPCRPVPRCRCRRARRSPRSVGPWRTVAVASHACLGLEDSRRSRRRPCTRRCSRAGATVATAESLTGGGVGGCCRRSPGPARPTAAAWCPTPPT